MVYGDRIAHLTPVVNAATVFSLLYHFHQISVLFFIIGNERVCVIYRTTLVKTVILIMPVSSEKSSILQRTN